MKPSAPALLLCLLLTACASEPMHYYHLAAADTPAPSSASTPLRTTPSTERLPLVIEVRLPDYLNTANIAYQRSEAGMALAQNNRWAEAPETAIARLLTTRLAQQMPETHWQSASTRINERAMSVRILLDQFNGRYDGRAVLAGQWQLIDTKQTVLSTQAIHLEIAQHGDGYQALVQALNQGVAQLATQIATELRAQPRHFRAGGNVNAEKEAKAGTEKPTKFPPVQD